MRQPDNQRQPGGTTEEDKRFWRLMAWVWLAVIAAGILSAIVNALRE